MILLTWRLSGSSSIYLTDAIQNVLIYNLIVLCWSSMGRISAPAPITERTSRRWRLFARHFLAECFQWFIDSKRISNERRSIQTEKKFFVAKMTFLTYAVSCVGSVWKEFFPNLRWSGGVSSLEVLPVTRHFRRSKTNTRGLVRTYCCFTRDWFRYLQTWQTFNTFCSTSVKHSWAHQKSLQV